MAMIWELVRNWNMQNRWESRWIPFEFEEKNFGNKSFYNAVCIEFVWEDVSGTLNGKISFRVSNNQKTFRVLKEIDVNSEDNRTNSYFLNIFYPSFQFFKVVYEPNGIANGRLSVGVLFK
jgi:hypothetical protein